MNSDGFIPVALPGCHNLRSASVQQGAGAGAGAAGVERPLCMKTLCKHGEYRTSHCIVCLHRSPSHTPVDFHSISQVKTPLDNLSLQTEKHQCSEFRSNTEIHVCAVFDFWDER